MAKKDKGELTIEERLAQLEKENAELRGTVREQAEDLKIAEATKPANAKPIVKIDGAAYRVNHGLRTQTKEISIQDIVNDQALCRSLIAKGSSALSAVVKK